MRFCFILVLVGSMKDHLKEGDGHGKQHPDVDHLDVRGDRQALGEAQEAKKIFFYKYGLHTLIGHFRVWSHLYLSNAGPFG